jgi:uncharacterized protein YjiS (DUF1127 family)
MIRTDVHAGLSNRFSEFASLTSPVWAGQRRYGAALEPVVRSEGRSWLARTADLLLAWSERARQRRELLSFDDHLLRDIGLTRAEALGEAEKPFWRD